MPKELTKLSTGKNTLVENIKDELDKSDNYLGKIEKVDLEKAVIYIPEMSVFDI